MIGVSNDISTKYGCKIDIREKLLNQFYIHNFERTDGETGNGILALKEICKKADTSKYQLFLHLEPSRVGYVHYDIDFLVKFYRRLDFQVIGQSDSNEGIIRMVRYPKR
jgi:hypothetical protein